MFSGEPNIFRQGPPLRAEGSLTYLDFIRLLSKMWTDAHPNIPMFGEGTSTDARYPCIVYKLDLRKPVNAEPKPKHREEIRRQIGEDMVIVRGQRFDNIITFSVFTENDVQTAEELIEVFEDFVMEYIGVFKRLGISEMLYARRMPDSGQNRQGRDVIERSVSFLVRTEKVIVSTEWKMNQILIDARIWLSQGATPDIEPSATPDINIVDQHGSSQ